ncbi:MAG: hypothetical protein LBR87_08295, partial [Synergistaceae bacterium]|nr:hypothetical protein [Synergistaceae bacterium]
MDREASERYFLSAYGHFLENRLWNTLDDLDESLGQNVYFVDVYYMRSLALRRLGRFPEAIEAMSYYLEVRRDDYRGRIILDSMKSEWEMISGMLSPSGPAYETGFSSRTVNSFFALPPYSPLALKGMSGIGKILCAGENIWVCDTLGGSVWVFGLNERYTLRADIQRPSALIPVSSSEALLFLEDGSVYRLGIDPASKETSLSEAGTIEADIADAAFIDSSLFAVADRRGGAVRFVGADGFEQAAEWRPPGKEADGPFEPVAVSSYGPLLAVADRGGGRIFVLDSYTMSVLGSFGINTPRDLEWGRQGELYILNESGVLYSCFPARDASADVRVTAEGMKDAWSISWMDEGPVISSVSGRTWWIGTAGPGRSETFGAITLHDPWITKNDDGTEMLMLRGAASSVFHGFVRDRTPVTQVVWRGEVRPSAVTGIKTVQEGLPRFYSPNAGPTP